VNLRVLHATISQNLSIKPDRLPHFLWNLRKDIKINSNGLLTFRNRIFVPEKLKLKFITSFHYGHQGIEAMIAKLTQDYFWPRMREDIKHFVKHCRVCSMVKPKFVNAALKPYLVDAPLQMVATDFIGPLPDDGGRRYILVIIDAFSRFPETYPVRDMSVSTVIECFRDYFSRYGFPDSILSDRGTQFQSKEFKEYISGFNIKKLSTTAYRPSSNGICERFNGTIQKNIKSLLCENDFDRNRWRRVLPVALMTYRNQFHKTTGFTPSQLFLSFKVKDLSLVNVADRFVTFNDFRTASKNIARRRSRAAKKHHYQNRHFPEGSSVIVKSVHKQKLGPAGEEATVVEQLNDHVVRITKDGRETNVSSARISPLPLDLPPMPSDVSNSHEIDLNVSDVSTSESPRPNRSRQPPAYLKDYILP